VEFTPRGIAALEFDSSARASRPQPVFIRRVVRDLQRYAAGKPVRWKTPFDLTAGTEFQRKVWRTLCQIPRGQTRSYAWVAKKIDKPKAVRAVGAACGANPVPIIIPCHRVIASDGSLGGFSAGLTLKKRLLALEVSNRRQAR
jgi:methylated-DNA-[protein]-cysteine S-methyltransferase